MEIQALQEIRVIRPKTTTTTTMYSRCGFGESGHAGGSVAASLLVKRKQERTSFYKRLLFFLLNPHHRSADMCAGLLKRGDDGGMVNKDERFILRR